MSVSRTAPAPGATVRLASDAPEEARAEVLLAAGGYQLGAEAAFLADLTMAERPVGVGVRTPGSAGEDQWRREAGRAALWGRRSSDYNLTLTLTGVSTGRPVYSAGAEPRARTGGDDPRSRRTGQLAADRHATAGRSCGLGRPAGRSLGGGVKPLGQKLVRHPIDVHVGGRMKSRRREPGVTQTQLARMLGVSFRQVQKYEHGGNRLSASRLYEVACALGVPVDYFFEGLDRRPPTDSGAKTRTRKWRTPGLSDRGFMVPPGRIELPTSALPRMRSTTELRRRKARRAL